MYQGVPTLLRRLRTLLLVVAAIVVCPSIANAATHQFGTAVPGGSWGCPPADFKYGNTYTLTEYAAVTKITAWMKGNGGTGSQSFRAMIYAANGPTPGAPGTLLATSQVVSVAATAGEGAVDFPISPAVSLTPGSYWIAQQSGPDGSRACLSATGSGANNFNNDPFGDGPSNPFNASSVIFTDSNLWTLSASFETDTTAPVITASAAPAPNANGWNNTDVTVTFSCNDNAGGSGVGTVSLPVTVSTEGMNQSVTGTCTDNAGNSSSTTKSGINIDKTLPSVTFAGNAGTYTVDGTVSITCAAADSLSGIAGSTCASVSGPAYGFGLGPRILSATATDKAGNARTVSTSFIVQVTAGSLCNLTQRFVQASSKYAALTAKQKATADVLWSSACRTIAAVSPRLTGTQKRLAVSLYIQFVTAVARDGWLNQSQADILTNLANAL
jgi:hypothetical protein